MTHRRGLFIVGCPRSGTSRLHHAVNSHPDIAIGLERYNIRAFGHNLHREHFDEDRFFGIEPNDTWYQSLDQFEMVYRDLRQKYATAKIVGDKTPRGYLIYDQISRIFDDVRFLLPIRNPFSIVASYDQRLKHNVDGNPKKDYRVTLEHWNESLHRSLDALIYHPILPVLYEELNGESGVSDRIATFLEVDAEPLRKSFENLSGDHPRSTLPDEVAAWVSRKADFKSYALLSKFAEHPPHYQQRRLVRGIGPAIVDKYSEEDKQVIDYSAWQLPNTQFMMRGPRATAPIEETVVCLGSAATFGRFVRSPFPVVLGEELNVPVLNLGIGGARPATYLECSSIKDILMRCRLVVVEVMSARSYRSSIFIPNNSHAALGHALIEMPTTASQLIPGSYFMDRVYHTAVEARSSADVYLKVTGEIRSAYIADMKEIASLIERKSILLYFSQRPLAYQLSFNSYDEWSGGFPHFIDNRVLELCSVRFTHVVEHVSKSGLPSPVLDKATGKPVRLKLFVGTHNTYYPSQEMHMEVAAKLKPIVARMLGR